MKPKPDINEAPYPAVKAIWRAAKLASRREMDQEMRLAIHESALLEVEKVWREFRKEVT